MMSSKGAPTGSIVRRSILGWASLVLFSGTPALAQTGLADYRRAAHLFLDFGKSMRCPIDARTVYPGPR